jgi:hypothetical protein
MFAGLRARLLLAPLVLFFGACDGADRLTNPSDNPTYAAPAAPVSFATSGFRGGIPIGTFGQPVTAFGTYYNGSKMTVSPGAVLDYLAGAKARGGRVILMMAGSPRYYVDGDGNFVLSKWKASVDRFKGIDLSSYMKDGTIIGHFLLDEPNDASNWNGKKVEPSTVEEMARYSKQIWPTMPTIIRADARYFDPLRGNLRYLDAAWAQYTVRKGTPQDFITQNVADAQRNGLALVVGLNISGGNETKTELNAQEVQSWGSTLLSSTYSCAFISWEYRSDYLDRSDIRAAMATLAEKAQNRSTKSCRAAYSQTSEPTETSEPAPTAPSTSGIVLKVTGMVEKDLKYYAVLNWSGASGSTVDLYRDGSLRKWSPPNTGTARVLMDPNKPWTVFKVCEHASSRCSNDASLATR